jgi:hypothetical protein
MTLAIAMWNFAISQRVRSSDDRSWAASCSTSASEVPTCSIPIATSFSPTVWRHMTFSGTSW